MRCRLRRLPRGAGVFRSWRVRCWCCWVSFYPFSQEEYLTIVVQWLHSLGLKGEHLYETAKPEALVWALERGSRSGRVAYQFARDFVGRHESS